MKEIQPLLSATMRASVGATVMVVKQGAQWMKARSEAQVLAGLNGETSYIIQTEAPDGRILVSLWDRIMGKQGAVMELPGGQGVQSVEITYKVINGG